MKHDRFEFNEAYEIAIFPLSAVTSEACLKPYRSSQQEVFCKKGILRNFGKFAGKHLFLNDSDTVVVL